MNAPKKIQDLVAEVVHAHPAARLELDPLPSGVCFLWVTVAARNFVLEYHPSQGTGVSENLPDTPPFVGHDRAFDSLEEGIGFFKQLLIEAAQTEPTEAAAAFHDRSGAP